jgi:hypothetical protein
MNEVLFSTAFLFALRQIAGGTTAFLLICGQKDEPQIVQIDGGKRKINVRTV